MRCSKQHAEYYIRSNILYKHAKGSEGGQIIPIRFGREKIKKINKLLDKSGTESRSEFIREAVKHYLKLLRKRRL